MPLQKQIASFQFRGGLDRKTDEKSVAPVKLLTCENALFTAPGKLQKRNGFTSLGRYVGSGSTKLADGQALMRYRDELVACDKNKLYSYDASSAQWVDKGTFVSCLVKEASVARSVTAQSGQDGATHSGGMQAYAWEEGTATRYAVVDSTTGQVIKTAQLAATSQKPRVLVVDNVFLFLYYSTADTRLYVGSLPVANPTATITFTAFTTATADANGVQTTARTYDAIIYESPSAGRCMYVAFSNAVVGGGISLWRAKVTAPATITHKMDFTFPGASGDVVTLFANRYDDSVVVAYYDSTSVRYRAQPALLVNSAGTALSALGAGAIETVTNVKSITGCSVSTTALDVRIYYARTESPARNRNVRTATISGAYSVSSPSTFMRTGLLAGKAFVHDSTAYVPLAFESTLQPAFFLANGSGVLVAKALGGRAGNSETHASGALMLPGPTAVDGSRWRLALREEPALIAETGAAYGDAGIVSVTVDLFEPAQSYLRAELAEGLHVGGGFLSLYDGVAPVEHGFLIFPEGVTVENPGGAFAYQYVACYEWTDAQGNLHRSAPSVAQTHAQGSAISGGATSTVNVPPLHMTNKTSYNVALYRTINGGTVFYRVTTTTITASDDTLNVFIVDSTADADLTGKPLLYTTGGVVENIAPPPVSSVAVHRNRLFALDSTNPLSVWYSKQVAAGAPVEFSDLFTLAIDPRGGDVTALASLDDKLVLFKKSSIFVVVGEGPDATGQNDDFAPASLVTTDCGCVNPRSVVMTTAGLMFQSTKGIYLLGRDLSVQYVGAEVEGLVDGQTVTSGVLLEATNEVRFTLGNRTALVYDYLVGQWAVFTNVAAVDAVLWDGQHCFIRSDGAVLKETPGTFTDDGSHVPLRIVTAWLQLAQQQGFQRVRRAALLGEYLGTHKLLVRVAYDFDPAPVQEVSITPIGPAAYGVDSPYGSGSPYGGDFPIYDWRIALARQKCTAVRFEVLDAPSGDAGESMSLSGLALEVGVLPGVRRLPAAKSVG